MGIYLSPAELGRLQFADLRAAFTAVHLDLGSGLGHFPVAMAARHPNHLWLALEVDRDCCRRCVRRVEQAGLTNIHVICIDARPFLADFVPPAALDHIWINFPDPWPKDRHAARRHSHPWMIGLMLNRLRAGGELHLATDVAEYGEAFAQRMSGHPEVERQFGGPWLRRTLGIETKYERKWKNEGRPLVYADWRKTRHVDDPAWTLRRVAPPIAPVLQLPAPGVARLGDTLIKVFSHTEGDPARARFLVVDLSAGAQTTGRLVLGDPPQLDGIWTDWKHALVRHVGLDHAETQCG